MIFGKISTKIFKWILLLGFLSIAYANSAPTFRFEHLSTENGLSHNSVIDILQDHQGFMWFGTLNGLDRYDGYSFVVYRPVPGDTTSLMHNVINAIYEDSRGILWIGTLNGLHRYDRSKDCFVRIVHEPDDPNSLVDNRIRCILEDYTGSLWIGTEGGLCCYDPSTDQFQNFFPVPNDSGSLSDYIVHDLFEDSRKQLWIATEEGGINRFNRRTGTFSSYRHLSVDPNKNITSAVMTICEDQWGTLWIGTWGDGLQRFDVNTNQFTRVSLTTDGSESCTSDIITNLLIDESGRLWICSYDAGLFFLSQIPRDNIVTGAGDFQHYQYDPHDATGIQSNAIWAVYVDRTGVVWVGNDNGGINKCDTKQSHISHYQSKIAAANSLSNDHVTSFFEDDSGIIWIGTRFGGLNRFDPQADRFRIYRHDPNQINSPASDAILCLSGGEDNLWIGTDGSGLDRLNTKAGQFEHFRHEDNDQSTLGENVVLSFCRDKSGKLWIGTWGGGLSCLNPDERSFTTYPVDRTNDRQNVVTSIIEAPAGGLWLGTYGKGLVFFDPVREEMTYFSNDESDSLSLGHDNINTLLIDKHGILWIGTMGAGLNYLTDYHPDSGVTRFGKYDQDDGLPDNIIEFIIEDDNGYLWLGTNHGIARLDPENGRIQNFDRYDGFGQDIFYHESVLRTRNGLLYFGGIHGFNVFHPSKISYNPYIPPVVVTQFQISNEPIGPKSIGKKVLNKSIVIADNLRLSYKDNVFSFEFAALDYSSPGKNQYAYMMEGFDKNWRYTDADRRFASYTNLPHGNYKFRVIASNNHGLWNDAGAAIDITITPPFWKTRWMMTIYLALILGAILLIRKAVQMRERFRTQVEMKRLEAEKVHEIDQLKLRFFTHISHEFRTPLTLIIGPIERMLQLGEQMNQYKRDIYNRLVLQNARRLLRLVNQLMDARKLDTGSMKLEIQEKEFVSFTKAIISAFQHRAEQKRIRISFDTALETFRFAFDPDKIEKVLYNIISNAVKFTEPEGEIEILLFLSDKQGKHHVETEASHRFICTQVKDTGIGIDSENIDHIFDPFYQAKQSAIRKPHGTGIGLSISKDFVEMHSGTIRAESQKGQGTTITFTLPEIHQPDETAIDNSSPAAPDQDEENADLLTEDFAEASCDVSVQDLLNKNQDKPLILTIEDDKDLRQYLVLEIEDSYSVIQAQDGLSGYELAVDRIPDLIICDVMMPVMDGYEFCQRCKNDQRTSHIPIILLTAQTSEEKQKDGLLAGADDYITKPFNPDLLKLRIENLLNVRRKMRERFGRIIGLNPQEIPITSPDEQFLQKIIEAVEQYLSDTDFSVDDLSYHIGLSRAQLYRKMQAVINQTPSDFIRTYRLQRAMQLLAKGHTPSQVCYQTGFRDPSYFSKCFRKQFGKTPQQIKSASKA